MRSSGAHSGNPDTGATRLMRPLFHLGTPRLATRHPAERPWRPTSRPAPSRSGATNSSRRRSPPARRRRRRRNRFVAIARSRIVLDRRRRRSASRSPGVARSPTATQGSLRRPASANSALAPPPSASENRTWNATFDTSAGTITATLDGAAAPQAVASFVTLAKDGFFNGTECHRLVDQGIYVLQCGSPDGTPNGGPGFRFGPIENAPGDDIYPAGTLAMARVGGDAYSMGSQFFFVYQDSTIPSDAAGGYTVFGTITDGLAILEGIGAAGNVRRKQRRTPRRARHHQ